MKHYGDDELNETDLGMARFSQALITDENQISKEEFIVGAASQEVFVIEKTPLEKLQMKNSEHKLKIQNQISRILKNGYESQARMDSTRVIETIKKAEIQN